MNRILLVEDDEMVGDGLKDILEMNDYKVLWSKSFTQAMDLIREEEFQLAILDIRLPDGNGIQLCRKLREYSSCPVLFLSGYEDECYIVRGLEAGGDDYIIKPFRTMELLARIQALLRRSHVEKEVIGYISGDLYMDLMTMRVSICEKNMELSQIEYRVLLKLMAARGAVVTPNIIIETVWNVNGNYADESAVRVWIARLRKQLDQAGFPDAIETCRGVGYRWRWKVRSCYRTQ